MIKNTSQSGRRGKSNLIILKENLSGTGNNSYLWVISCLSEIFSAMRRNLKQLSNELVRFIPYPFPIYSIFLTRCID